MKSKQLFSLAKRFQKFWQNRLYASTNAELREQLVDAEEQKYLYHPSISSITVQLANKKKQQIKSEIQQLQNEMDAENQLQDYDQNLLLGYQKLKSDQEKEKMRQEIEENAIAECTFQPNCFKDQYFSVKDGVKKSEELHAQASTYHQQKKIERNTQEIEYEKNCDQCTFQPDIHFFQSSLGINSRINPTMHSQESISKNINRIKEGRQKKLLEEQIKQQGHTMNENKRSIQKYSVELAEEEYITSLREHRPQQSFQQNRSLQKSLQQSSKKKSQYQGNEKAQLSQVANFDQLPNQLAHSEEKENQDNNLQENDLKRQQDQMSAPLLFVDVNIEEGQAARIIVREGDTAQQLAESFAREHSFFYKLMQLIKNKDLDDILQEKLEELLEQQIKNLLTKIDEEEETSENPNQMQ